MKLNESTDLTLVSEDDFFSLLGSSSDYVQLRVNLGDGTIPVRIKRRDSSCVVFAFAGAVNRARRKPPQFGGSLLADHVNATVIGFADPSIELGDDFTAAWYCGHEGFELQTLLPPLLEKIVERLQASRVVFVGGSVGGFAALYYSWKIPESVVLANNPQTNLERYGDWHQQQYRKFCRPSLRPTGKLRDVIDSDVTALYAKRFENTVVYLQNSADPFHVRNHFAPFVASVGVLDQERLLPRLSYWGPGGHNATNHAQWLRWLRAILDAPDSSADAIQATCAEPIPVQLVGNTSETKLNDDVRLAGEIASTVRSSAGDLENGHRAGVEGR